MAQGGFNRWSAEKAADKVSAVEIADAESLFLENLTPDSDFGQFCEKRSVRKSVERR